MIFLPKKIVKPRRADLGLRDDEKLIGMIGNFEPSKGHLDFLNAAAILKRQSNHPVRFLIAGRELELRHPYALQVKERIEQLQLVGDVILAGYRSDIPDLLSAIDVLVVPSIWEPLGVIVMEGMAAGKPVVATNAGGIPEMLRHNEHGLLFPPHDADNLASCVEFLLDNPEIAHGFGKTAKARIWNGFTPEKAANAYERVYFSLMAEGRGTFKTIRQDIE